MQGNIWVVPNPQGYPQSMALVLRFQLQPCIGIAITEAGESSENPNSAFEGLQVLLADGDNMNRAVSKKLLQKLGCSVTAVSSGFECLNALGPAGSCFQILLLDVHMHDLNGFEVASRIRKLRSRSLPLTIAVIASDEDDFWEKFKEVGINGVIRKPVLLPELIDELRRVLLQV